MKPLLKCCYNENVGCDKQADFFVEHSNDPRCHLVTGLACSTHLGALLTEDPHLAWSPWTISAIPTEDKVLV